MNYSPRNMYVWDAWCMTFGTISTPKLLRTSGDRLVAAYWDGIESRVTAELIGPRRPPVLQTEPHWGQIWQMPTARWTQGTAIAGHSQSGWGVALLGHRPESFIFEAAITLQGAPAAGLAIRLAERMLGGVVALEAAGSVFYADVPAFDFEERRITLVPAGEPIHLRVVSRREHIEIYVRDELCLAFSRYRGIGGEVGLFVDRGAATFSDIRLRELRVDALVADAGSDAGGPRP